MAVRLDILNHMASERVAPLLLNNLVTAHVTQLPNAHGKLSL